MHAKIATAVVLRVRGHRRRRGESTLLDAAKRADRAAALAALDLKPDPNLADSDGSTALLWAVHNDDLELVKRLIAAGARRRRGERVRRDADVRGGRGRERRRARSAARSWRERRFAEPRRANGAHGRGAQQQRRGRRAPDRARRERQRARGAQGPDCANVGGCAESARDGEDSARARCGSRRTLERQRLGAPRDGRAAHEEHAVGGFTPLLYAARQGCLDCARQLVATGAAVDRTDPDGITPLLSALLNAHFDTAKFLLDAGANPNKWDWWGRTPLYSAVDYNTVPHGGRPDRPSLDDTTSLQMIEILLDMGANPNAQLKLFPPYRSLRMDRGADAIIDIGTTPLFRAARGGDTTAIDLLIPRGALVDLPQVAGITPLMAAVGMGANAIDTRGKFRTELDALATAERLLGAGADVNARDDNGRTALHAAASQGYTDVVKFLVEQGADVGAKDGDGNTPADAALGKMRGRGRATGQVHTATAELLAEFSAATAR